MPVNATQAWREAAATVDASEVMLPTLELRHSQFLEGATLVAVRLVADTQDRTFRIEAGAPMNAGTLQPFLRCPFRIGYPRIGKFGAECPLAIDNVKREIHKYAQAAIQINEPIRVRFRGYLASDPETVGLGPYEMVLRGARFRGALLEASITTAMPRNMRVLTDVFDTVRFPALTQWT